MKSITINKVGFTYNKSLKIFEDFSWQFDVQPGKGRVTAIMGPSGAGKSTLLKLLLGIIKPQSGTITMLPNNPVVAYVPQEPVLFEHLSVEDNARYFSFAGAHKNKFDEKLYQELTKDLGLNEVIGRAKSVNEMSGGQKQRLCLLRALSINPDFLLLDEPCNGLDAEVKKAFLNKLREVTIQHELAVLYITHHKLEAQLIADDVVYLTPDKDAECIRMPVQGSINQFLQSPPILDAANVFRFPDLKILPISRSADGSEIICNKENATDFLLLEDNNLVFLDKNAIGWSFKIVSLSPVFGILRNDESDTEWMVSAKLLTGYNLTDTVKISISGKYYTYNEKGVLIQ